jgi:hypothetical protein
MKHRLLCGVACVILVMLSVAIAETASAIPVGPVFPPPGGVTFTAGGAPSAGDPAGRDFTFSGFDTNFFSALYWGPSSVNLPQAALDGTLDAATSFSVSGTTATWSGTTTWTNPNTSVVTTNVPWELRIDISGLGTTPWVQASTLGLPSPVGYVVDDSAGTTFTANLKFVANVGSGFVAMNTIQQSPSTPSLTQTSFGGGFYFDRPSAVPEPASLLLTGLGMFVVSAYASRRAQRSTTDSL